MGYQDDYVLLEQERRTKEMFCSNWIKYLKNQDEGVSYTLDWPAIKKRSIEDTSLYICRVDSSFGRVVTLLLRVMFIFHPEVTLSISICGIS